jgi:hypothetical protein
VIFVISACEIECGGQLEQFLYCLIATLCRWLVVNRVVCPWNVNVVSAKGLVGAFVYVYLEVMSLWLLVYLQIS